MPRGPSQASKSAAAFLHKNPDTTLTAAELAKKFGLNQATVFRSAWWKDHRAAQAKQAL